MVTTAELDAAAGIAPQDATHMLLELMGVGQRSCPEPLLLSGAGALGGIEDNPETS